MANIEMWGYLNGKLVSHEIKEMSNQWKSEKDDPIYQSMQKKIGIGAIHEMYIETNDIQEKDYEYRKIMKFLAKYVQAYAEKRALKQEDLKLEFINYGKTELVYVLTEPSGKRITLLTKQPAVAFGKVKQEAIYLKELKKKDDMVVAPIDYFCYGDQELYVTPYINQARCIASDGCWGMYIPEPHYRFEGFTPQQEKVVLISMIAKLVSFYDLQKNQGIAACKLGGGDFMLPKGWEKKENISLKDTLNSLYFIACREKIDCSFAEYLDIIRDEFSRATIRENQNSLKLNHRGRVPMRREYIEQGIALGKKLLQANQNTNNIEIE